MNVSATLPDYADEIAGFHQAFAKELAHVVAAVPLPPTAEVLDVGCGDGFYLRLLADRLRRGGRVIGLDSNAAFLEKAKARLAKANVEPTVEFICGNLFDALPTDRFDLVWCAQSLYSFPEPVAALRAMAHAARSGGLVAVLENDTLHQLLLPWPSDLEIALRAAELAAFSAESRCPEKFYVGRRLPCIMAQAGLEPVAFETRTIDRAQPLAPALQSFLTAYLSRLEERVRPFLDANTAERLHRYIDPTDQDQLLRDPYLTITWLNIIASARKP